MHRVPMSHRPSSRPAMAESLGRHTRSLLATLAVLAGLAMAAPPSHAQGTRYIQVRVTKVMLSDDLDDMGAGEINWVFAASTGNKGRGSIATQTLGFPLEKWYEASTNGANSVLMGVGQQGVPVFNFPEAEMGDSLVLSFGILDDDTNPDALLLIHDIARAAGVAVATAFTGPAGGAIVLAVSQKIQDALENDDADVVGYAVVAHGKSDRFGTRATGTYTNAIQTTNGKATITYNVRRTWTPNTHKDWCVAAKLTQVKVLEDGDPSIKGDGEVYIRARVADGFSNSGNASVLHQQVTPLPANGGTKDVGAGHYFHLANGAVLLYSNRSGGSCRGLPPFLYVEVDVLEDDDEDDDDILGVLPIMLSAGWLREHPGTTPFTYTVRGADSDEKVRITVQIEVWNPNADPDARPF